MALGCIAKIRSKRYVCISPSTNPLPQTSVTNKYVVRLIFGLKVKELRKQRGLSFAELSRLCGMSVSYLNEIEKGKKYPKADKILALADALDTSYDHLVSLKLGKRLAPVAELLNSNFLHELPLEIFGLEVGQLMELIGNAPAKVNAFIGTLIEIARGYEMRQEQFYFAALRSYQELHDNYFGDLEEAAALFRKEFSLKEEALKPEHLAIILESNWNYEIDFEGLSGIEGLEDVRSLFNKNKRKLMIHPRLNKTQELFILAREIAFQILELQNRPQYTPFLRVKNFEEALNNFKASYFAVALIIPKANFIKDIQHLFNLDEWTEADFLGILDKYGASPEMFHQRLTNLLPKEFGIRNLFMLRFSIAAPEYEEYFITKQLHLARRHSPHANELNEHYCRRWVSLSILQNLRNLQMEGKETECLADFQRSSYVGSQDQYLCISLARPNNPSAANVSVTTGLLVDDKLRKKIKVLENDAIPIREVNETCERCPLTDCEERAAEMEVIKRKEKFRKMEKAVNELLD